jgi:hypothetical protein
MITVDSGAVVSVESVLDDVVRVDLIADGVGVLLSRSGEHTDCIVFSDSLQELLAVWSKENSHTLTINNLLTSKAFPL